MEAALQLQERLQAATNEYQKLQTELSNAVEARQKLDAQLSENELVKKVRSNAARFRMLLTSTLQEFAQLTPNNTVYKLVGPVLVSQDHAEAKSTVDKRLDFIRGDMYVHTPTSRGCRRFSFRRLRKRVEAQLKDLGEKSEKMKLEVSPVQCLRHYNDA